MSARMSRPSGSARLGAGADLIGESLACQRVRQLIERMAPTDRPLLIRGPTGAGKEVVARRVHRLGIQPEAPFVDVNCAAIPENLVESELFGHARGAFTGASNYRAGFFQQVGPGTLFLDEIGELPLALQPKLLRVLETREFRPVGSTDALPFHGRIVAATHRDLAQMVRDGQFREDLYYRLAVFVVELPGLDQRKEDIPALVRHFAGQQSRALSFTPEAMQRLYRQDWPGNVRQLRNLIDQLSVLAEDSRIDLVTLAHFLPGQPEHTDLGDELADAVLKLPGGDKLELVQDWLTDRALARCNGNKSAAAQLLGVSRKTVERRLKAREAQALELDAQLARGRQAVETGEFRSAIPLLRRASELAQDPLNRFEALRLLGISLRSVNGWLCPQAQACYQAAFEAGRDHADPQALSTLQFGLWASQLMTLSLGQARATAQDMLQRAQHLPMARMEAHVAMANTLFWLGDGEETLACLARGDLLGGARPGGADMQGFDLSTLALTLEGLAAFQCGRFAQARTAMDILHQRASAQHHTAFNRVMALQGAGWLAALFEATNQLAELGQALHTLAHSQELDFYQGIGRILAGCARAAQGDSEGGETDIRLGYEQHIQRDGGVLFHSFQAWQRGDILLRAGQARQCLNLIGQAIDLALEHQERAYLGELLVVRARALWALGEPDVAEQELRGVISTAMALGSTPARLAAAHQLALLLRERGQFTLAQEALARALRGVEADGGAPVLARVQALQQALLAEY